MSPHGFQVGVGNCGDQLQYCYCLTMSPHDFKVSGCTTKGHLQYCKGTTMSPHGSQVGFGNYRNQLQYYYCPIMSPHDFKVGCCTTKSKFQYHKSTTISLHIPLGLPHWKRHSGGGWDQNTPQCCLHNTAKPKLQSQTAPASHKGGEHPMTSPSRWLMAV